ncbi:MAG TPA: hypothetical protein VIL97_07090 [Thermoanaerobaculia bacterium]
MRGAVHYTLRWDDPNQHLYDVSIRFRAPKRETVLRLPAWRPGRYLIQNYAANVRQWSAADSRRKPLRIEKRDKTTWIVRASAGERVVVSYRFYAGVLDAGSSFLDESEAYFNGSNLLMMVEPLRGERTTLAFEHPEEWTVETQLPRKSDGLFHARDYDHLIDSPAIASPSLVRHSFRESGTEIILAFQNAEGIDTKRFVKPVRKIVRAHARLFGGIPTPRYAFLYHLGSLWHGVEHEDSCSIILRRADLLGAREGSEGFDHFLGITSHELFHLWNVKRIVPAAFAPYDYSRETYTRLLWVMEGVTSYYGGRMILRSGVWSTDRYLEHLAREITTLETSPGREFLSVAQASFDAWLQEPAQMHDKANAWISFYNKGEIVGALLDLAIRRATRGKKSLDDVMRLLWERYGKRSKGLEEEAFERAVERVASVGDFFGRYVSGTEPLPYEELFGSVGVRFVRKRASAERISFGWALKKSEGKLLVETVPAASPARLGGALPNDELIAIGGHRVTSPEEVDRVAASVAGRDGVPVILSRAGVVSTRMMKPIADATETIVLSLGERRDGTQERLLRGWIGAER